MEKFLAGATIKIRTDYYDDDDALIDVVTSMKITITDPDDGAAVTDGGMSSSTTGIYTYYYTTTVDVKYGTWRYVITGTDTDYKSLDSGTFDIVEFLG